MNTTTPAKNDWLLFFVFFSWIFALSLALLNIIGFVPYYVDGTAPTLSDVYIPGEERVDTPEVIATPVTPEVVDPGAEVVAPALVVSGYLPDRIAIPSLKKSLKITSPQSRDVEILDKALLTSVVRYPGSGLLGKDGNVFIFGHSTGYRTVHNDFFKAFNGIQNLEKGAVIELYGGGKVHVYQVETVVHEDASDAQVDLRVANGERKLTLSTCDSFGKKTSRFVVTALFLSEYDDEPEAAKSSGQ